METHTHREEESARDGCEHIRVILPIAAQFLSVGCVEYVDELQLLT